MRIPWARTTITYATTAVLALHVALGCCWHHPHVEGLQNSPPLHEATCCRHGQAVNHQSPRSSQPDDIPHEPHLPADCQGERCIAVLPQATGQPAAMTGRLELIVGDSIDLAVSPQSINAVALGDDQQVLTLPVRAHLLIGVLLL